MNSFYKDLLHLLVSIQQLIKNMIMFCLYSFSLHHQESKIAFAIKMYTLNAMIDFIVNMTFLLQVIAMFIRMHDSMLRTCTFKKIFAMQDKVFDCVMKKHEEKVIFKIKILKENLVLKLFHMRLHNCYDSSYASMLIAMLMTMLMTMFLTIVNRSSLDYRVVSKSTLFRVSLCSSESYR